MTATPTRYRDPADLDAEVLGLPFRPATPHEGERLVIDGLARRVIGDVLVARDAPDERRLRAVAAALLIPGRPEWVVGFTSAVWLLTGHVQHTERDDDGAPTVLSVIVPPGARRPARPGVRGRQVGLRQGEVVLEGPVAVTAPLRTAADCARDLAPPDAVAALQRLGAVLGVRPPQVIAQLASMPYARGVARARNVVRAWEDAGVTGPEG